MSTRPPSKGPTPKPPSNPIRNKTILSVDKRGRMATGAVIKHPSPVERIAYIHRQTQSKLRAIARKVDPHVHKPRGR